MSRVNGTFQNKVEPFTLKSMKASSKYITVQRLKLMNTSPNYLLMLNSSFINRYHQSIPNRLIPLLLRVGIPWYSMVFHGISWYYGTKPPPSPSHPQHPDTHRLSHMALCGAARISRHTPIPYLLCSQSNASKMPCGRMHKTPIIQFSRREVSSLLCKSFPLQYG